MPDLDVRIALTLDLQNAEANLTRAEAHLRDQAGRPAPSYGTGMPDFEGHQRRIDAAQSHVNVCAARLAAAAARSIASHS